MKVERSVSEARESRERSARNAGPSAALAESFNLALRRYRPQASANAGAHAEEGRKRADRVSSREKSRAEDRSRKADSSSAEATDPLQATSEGLQAAASDGREHNASLAALMRGTDPTAQLSGAARAATEARRPRRSGSAEDPHCIEVVDPRTGTRFILSREGEAWLLSIKTKVRPSGAELDALLATLRTHFSNRGLGTVDLVIA